MSDSKESNELPQVPSMPDQDDLLRLERKMDLHRENCVKRFEAELERVYDSFKRIEEPSDDDLTALSATLSALRERLVIDLLGTAAATSDQNSVSFFTNLIGGALEQAYLINKIAFDVTERFATRLENRGKDQGLPPDQFPRFTEKDWFLDQVALISKIHTLDTLMNGIGESVRHDRKALIDTLIALHYPQLRHK